MSDIYEVIAKKINDMSNAQKKIATFILNNRVEVAFLNVKQLAAQVGVSEASIIRFANCLGFSGYSELQRLLQQKTKNQLEGPSKEDQFVQNELDGIETVFEAEIMHIQKTLDQLKRQDFLKIVECISNAPRVFIMCGQSTSSLGSFLEYYLKIILENVYFIQTYDGKEELISSIGSQDIVIGITFERYTKKTVDLIAYASRKGAQIIGITDHIISPIIEYTNHYLLVETYRSKYVESFVAPQVLINALLTYVAKSKNMSADERFSNFKNICDELDIFM